MDLHYKAGIADERATKRTMYVITLIVLICNLKKMKQFSIAFILTGMLLIVLTVASCSDELGHGYSRHSFSSEDSVALLGVSAMNVTVDSIKYVISDSSWVDKSYTGKVYNLMMLSNNDTSVLSKISLPNGKYVKYVKLTLGTTKNLILSDGTSKTFTLSSQKDSLLFVVNQSIPSSGSYSIMLYNSVLSYLYLSSSGGYRLTSSIPAYIVNATSSIKGYILPSTLVTKIFIVQGTDTISTKSDKSNNNYFKLSGLKSGSYKVQFYPIDSAKVTYSTTVKVRYGVDISFGYLRLAK
jgi:hypothetical protein